MHHVFVVSDSTGRTAEQALKAALTQFSDAKINIERRPGVRTEEQVRRIVQEASESGAFILHTLVSDELRKAMLRAGRELNVETIDIMGPLLGRLSEQLSISPAEKPGLFRQLNEEYFRRMETMEFAIHHDDGMLAEDLPKAEIVLLGVSRTFKTPLSIYLAFKGWLAANVPIVLGIQPPSIIFELPPERVFCLTTKPERLADLRKVRHIQYKEETGEYADPDYVRREVKYALGIFSKQPGWPIIDVTNKPIEEIAFEILTLASQSRSKG